MRDPQYVQFLEAATNALVEEYVKTASDAFKAMPEEERASRIEHLRGEASIAIRGDAEAAAQREFMRWKCKTDLYFLASKIFGLEKAKVRFLNGKTRMRWDPIMHKELCDAMSSPSNSLILEPRGYMKSAVLKMYAVQCVLNNPEVRIGMWTKTATLAKGQLKSIKGYFRNPLLRELFPEIPDQKKYVVNNAEALTVWRDPESVVQENQIEIHGVDTTVTGNHYDIHLYDDIIDQDTVKDSKQIQDTLDWWEDMQFIRDIAAYEKVIGTRYHINDIYNHIIREGHFEENEIHVRSAIEGGKSIYSLWTLRDLARLKKKMGPDKFAAQMQNVCVPRGSKIFIPPYPTYDITRAPKKRKYYIAIDPAATAKRYSDETGISVGFVDRDEPRVLFVEESYGVKMQSDALANEIVRQIARYRPYQVGIETGLQTALKALIMIKIREWEEEHHGEFLIGEEGFVSISTGNTAKAVKLERTLGAFLRDERIRFPSVHHGDIERVSQQMDKVIAQLDNYNPHSDANADDIIDSLSMLIQSVEHFAVGNWGNVERGGGIGITRDWIVKEFRNTKKERVWDSKLA